MKLREVKIFFKNLLLMINVECFEYLFREFFLVFNT